MEVDDPPKTIDWLKNAVETRIKQDRIKKLREEQLRANQNSLSRGGNASAVHSAESAMICAAAAKPALSLPPLSNGPCRLSRT